MVFAVPLPDGSFGLAQAVDAMMVNVIYVALFSDRFPAVPGSVVTPRASSALSLTATWRQALNRGDWPSVGGAPLAFTKAEFPSERFAASGYVGAKHYDAGILAKFLAAYHGLLPWNVMFDESFYDQLLLDGVKRPSTAVVLGTVERDAYRREHLGIEPKKEHHDR